MPNRHNTDRSHYMPKMKFKVAEPTIGDHLTRALLAIPDITTLRGVRDRFILSTLLFHGLRRAELCRLTTDDLPQRRGVTHLQVHGDHPITKFLLPSCAACRGGDEFIRSAKLKRHAPSI
jgi:integrase